MHIRLRNGANRFDGYRRRHKCSGHYLESIPSFHHHPRETVWHYHFYRLDFGASYTPYKMGTGQFYARRFMELAEKYY